MSKIVNNSINDVLYRGAGCDALYHGANLIWKKKLGDILNVTSASPTYKFEVTAGEYEDFNSNQDYVVDINKSITVGLFSNNTWQDTYAKNILKINKFPDTSNCTNIGYFFEGCSSLTEVPILRITDKCTTAGRTFRGCTNLESIDMTNWDTKNLIGFGNMFLDCISLSEIKGIENIDTSSLNVLSGAFEGCKNLTYLNLDNFVGNYPTSIRGIFSGCIKLQEVSLRNLITTNIQDMSSMCMSCDALTQLYLGDNWDMRSVTGTTYMFDYCRNLTTVDGKISNISVNIDLHYSPLTNDSAMVFINGLAKVTSRKTISFSKTTYATLTDEQRKIATDKGWTIASA